MASGKVVRYFLETTNTGDPRSDNGVVTEKKGDNMVKPAMIRRKAMDLNADLVQLESLLKSKRRNGTYKENTDGVLLYGVETCRKAIEDLRDRLVKYEAYK